jgi:hypothetical protein
MLSAIGPHLVPQIISGGTAFLYGTVCSRPYNQIAERSIACMYNDHVLQVSLHQATLVLFNAWFYSHISAVTVSPALVVGAALIPFVWGAIYWASQRSGVALMDVGMWQDGMRLMQHTSIAVAALGAVLIGFQGHVVFSCTFGSMLLLGQLKLSYMIFRSVGNAVSDLEFSTAVLGALLIGAWYDRLRATADVGLRIWHSSIRHLRTRPIFADHSEAQEFKQIKPCHIPYLTADNLALNPQHLSMSSIFPPETDPSEYAGDENWEKWKSEYKDLAETYFTEDYVPHIVDGLLANDEHFRLRDYLRELIVDAEFSGGEVFSDTNSGIEGRLHAEKIYISQWREPKGWVRSINTGETHEGRSLGLLDGEKILGYVRSKFDIWLETLADKKKTDFKDVRHYALWCLRLLKEHADKPADPTIDATTDVKRRRCEEIAYLLAGLGWNLRDNVQGCDKGHIDIALSTYGQLAHAGEQETSQRVAGLLAEERKKILHEFIHKLTSGEPIEDRPGFLGFINRTFAWWSSLFIGRDERHFRNLILQILRQKGFHMGRPEEEQASDDHFYRMSLTELVVWWNIDYFIEFFKARYCVENLNEMLQGTSGSAFNQQFARELHKFVATSEDEVALDQSIMPEVREVQTAGGLIQEQYLWALLVRHGVLKVIDPSLLQEPADAWPSPDNALA